MTTPDTDPLVSPSCKRSDGCITPVTCQGQYACLDAQIGQPGAPCSTDLLVRAEQREAAWLMDNKGHTDQAQTPVTTGDSLWDRVMARCPRCHAAHRLEAVADSCGYCGFCYGDSEMLLDRIYLEVNAMGGTPVDGPVNTTVGEVLEVLRRLGAVDIETERR